MKTEDKIADVDFVGVVQLLTSFKGISVQKSSISTAQIFDVVIAVTFENTCVMTADGGIVQDDLATGMTSQNHTLTFQFQNLPRATPLENFEYGHGVFLSCHVSRSKHCYPVRIGIWQQILLLGILFKTFSNSDFPVLCKPVLCKLCLSKNSKNGSRIEFRFYRRRWPCVNLHSREVQCRNRTETVRQKFEKDSL